MKPLATLLVAAAFAAAAVPADAAVVGVPTGQQARIQSSIAATQRRNDAAIAHVGNSIAATRAKRF